MTLLLISLAIVPTFFVALLLTLVIGCTLLPNTFFGTKLTPSQNEPSIDVGS